MLFLFIFLLTFAQIVVAQDSLPRFRIGFQFNSGFSGSLKSDDSNLNYISEGFRYGSNLGLFTKLRIKNGTSGIISNYLRFDCSYAIRGGYFNDNDTPILFSLRAIDIDILLPFRIQIKNNKKNNKDELNIGIGPNFGFALQQKLLTPGVDSYKHQEVFRPGLVLELSAPVPLLEFFGAKYLFEFSEYPLYQIGFCFGLQFKSLKKPYVRSQN